MSTKHTLGPWRVEQNTTLVWGACDTDDQSTWGMGYPVAEARYGPTWNLRQSSPTEDEAIANAYLIASSPTLLFVLKQFVGAIEDVQYSDLIDAARAAIARAEGRDAQLETTTADE